MGAHRRSLTSTEHGALERAQSDVAQAPLQAYAKLLRERARQQRALLGAEEVEAGGPAADAEAEAGAAEDDDGAAEDPVTCCSR